jgi:anaerobic selenocysteine-containing dehydrogenase
MPQRHYRTCNLCEAVCGIVIEHDDGRVLSIRGDEEDPFSQGHVCPKAVALQDIDADPDRLRRPVRRVGDQWVEMDWDEAFDLVAARLHAVQDRHGRDAVAIYNGNPTVHSLGAMLFVSPFVRALRTRNRYSATSVDQLPHHVAASLMFGHMFLIPIPDLDRTDHLLVFGANPAASNGSLMTAGNVMGRIRGIRQRGGRVVVVDPRRTETADHADQHVFIHPGTDALLLLSILHVLLAEGLARPGRLEPMFAGVETARDLARRFPPERVAQATGVSPGTVRQLARDFAVADHAVCYGRVGISMQEFGTLACWLVNLLNALTGNLDREGGAMFPTPAVDLVGARGVRQGRWKTRVRSLPEFEGELPAAAMAEEMDTPGPGQVRALVTQSGNPVLSTPNGARLDRAIAGLEFYVALDFYINETTRHAHVILPPAGPLERDHFDLAFNILAVRNIAKLSTPLRPRSAGSRHDWEILNALTWRLARGTWARVRARARSAARGVLGPRGLLDAALRRGPHGTGWRPLGRGLSVSRLLRAPHGLDLGPHEPRLPGRLRTADRRIHLAPPELVADVERLEASLARAAPEGRLVLIGRRALRSNNSWMHNAERLVRGKEGCTLLMHPSDAAARGLEGGSLVRATSRVGTVEARLALTDAIMPGVVSLPHGWGHGKPGARLGVANRHPGASINDLTDDQRIDVASGTAAFSGVPVDVVRAGVESP